MLCQLLDYVLSFLLCLPTADHGRGVPQLNKDYALLVQLLVVLNDAYYIRVGEVYNGKVLVLTKDTITVQTPGRVPRTFAVAPTLCSDRIPLDPQLSLLHRLRDVRRGDLVGVRLARGRDGYVCIALGIYRRPGGKIPPAEDDHLPENCRSHIRCNADQAREEKVTLGVALMFLQVRPGLRRDW